MAIAARNPSIPSSSQLIRAPRLAVGIAAAMAALLIPGGCPAPDGGGNANTNGGGGGGGGGNTSLQVTGPRLLNTSARNGDVAILTFRRDATLTGDVAPAAILNGPATDLGTVTGLAVNSAGQLVVVCAQLDGSRNRESTINIFADATRLNGDQAPIRQVTMTGVNAFQLNGCALDRSRDILYVSYRRLVNTISTEFIGVFEGTARGDFDGARAPLREFRCANLRGASSFAVDEARDELHVGGFDSGSIIIFRSPSTRNGEAATCDQSYGLGGRVAGFTLETGGGVAGLSRSSNVGSIVRLSDTGPMPANLLDLEIDGALFANRFAIDGAGTAFVSDTTGAARILIFDNVRARASGTFAPDRIVTGGTAGVGGSNAFGSGLLVVVD